MKTTGKTVVRNSYAQISKKTDAGIAVVVVTLIILSVLSFSSKNQLIKQSSAITDSSHVINELKALLVNLQDADNSVNSYLLAEDSDFLNQYRIKSVEVVEHFKILSDSSGGDQDRNKTINKLYSLLTEKQKQLQFIIQLRQSKEYKKELLEPHITQGSYIMKDIRDLVEQEEMRERNLLANHLEATNDVAAAFPRMILFTCAFAVVALWLSRKVLVKQLEERSLTEREFQKVRLALEHSVEGIIRLDVDSKVISSNKAFSALLALDSAQILGRSWLALVSDGQQEKIKEAVRKIIVSGREELDLAINNEFYKATLIPTFDDQKKFDGYFCFLKSITKEKNEQEELEKAREKAVEASSAKSEFLANMSHEIRTPLNGVIGMSELLFKTSLNEKQKQYIDTIMVSAKSLLTLINDILDFSKIESRKMVLEAIDFDLYQLLDEIKQMFIHSAKDKGIDLVFEITQGIPRYFKGDPGKIRQVFINLVGNAIKFTNKGRVAIFVTGEMMGEGTYGELRFEIEDTGIGMSAETVGRLFKPFSQADSSTTRKFGGTGLGLAICKRLAEMMNGDLSVRSEEGKGSAFSFTIRLQVGNAVVKEKEIDTGVFKVDHDIHLLVVEDNLVNQQVVKEMLEQMGFKVKTAENGKVAVDIFNTTPFDLIFMDCQMAVMDGYEATRQIRKIEVEQKRKKIPVLALTANVTSEDRDKCFAAGMDDFLNKPVDFDKLKFSIHKWLNEYSLTANLSTQENPVEHKLKNNDLIDWNKIEQLKKLDLNGLLKIYFETTGDYLAKIKSAIEKNQFEELRESAHGLKGSSLNLGLVKVADLSKTLEDLGKAKQIDQSTVEKFNTLVEYVSKSKTQLEEGIRQAA